MDKSEANCRQIIVRARERIDEGKPRFEADLEQQQELADRFLAAFEQGEVDRLVDLLAADVVFYGDGGGLIQAIRSIINPDAVAPLELSGRKGMVFERDRQASHRRIKRGALRDRS